MEWLWILGGIIAFAVIMSAISQSNERKTKEARIKAFNAAVTAEWEKLIEGNGQALLPALDAQTERYRPVAKEILLAVQDGVTRMEMKSTGRYRQRGASISIPIVKGVRFRVGSGTVRGEKSWQATGEGRLLITDKALAFEGGTKNERITWGQIADIEVLVDGISIFKRSGPPRTYSVDNQNPKFAAVASLMLARTE